MAETINWIFPSNNNGALSGIADSGIETFKGTRIKSLAREICQNSLDATALESEPTRVDFTLFEIPVSDIPDVANLMRCLHRCNEFGINQRNPKATEFFENAINALSQDKILCLRISDFNTSGLVGSKANDEDPSSWRDLTKSQGASEKSGSNGGSFGIGKFAPFACSTLRTVFYSTLDSDGVEAYQGVARLTSFRDDLDGDVKQGIGFFGDGEKLNNPKYEQISLDTSFKRAPNTVGTDLFILGFIAEEDWLEKMIASVLDGFLYAVFTNKLIVNVNGVEVSQATLPNIIDTYKQYCEEYAHEYYAALTLKEDTKVFEGDICSMGKVTLYLALQADMHRKVAMVRKTGMKIMDKGNISRLIKFSGLLYIEGEELNEFLRSLENPQHTKWENERSDNPGKARAVRTEMTQFIKKCLDALKNESSDEAINPSVGEYLTEEPDPDSPEDRAENLNDDVKDFQKRVVKVHKPKEDDFKVPGEGTASVDDDNGELSTEDVPGSGSKGGDFPTTQSGGTGGKDYGEGAGPHPTEHKKSPAGVAASKLRVMSDNGEIGKYIISFTPSASADDCTLVLFLSAESDKYEADVISACDQLTGRTYNVNKNTISGLTFTEGTTLTLSARRLDSET